MRVCFHVAVLREEKQTRDLIVATIAIWVSVAVWVSIAIAICAATVCASWAVWAICVGAKLLSELLLLRDGFFDLGLVERLLLGLTDLLDVLGGHAVGAIGVASAVG